MASDPRLPITLPQELCQPGRRLLITSAPDEGPWDTRIALDSSSSHLAVFAPHGEGGTVRRFPGALLKLEIPIEQALYRCFCSLIDEIREPSPLWILGDFFALERVERRRAQRWRGAFGCEVIPQLKGEITSFALPPNGVRNLSITGCYLQGTPPLPLGTAVRVVLHLAEEAPVIALKGKVVRQDQPSEQFVGHGIAFEGIEREDRQAIARFIASHDRRAPVSSTLLA